MLFIIRYKKGRKHDYDIYKKNHPITHREVVDVFDLGYLGVETDFPGQLSALPYKKKEKKSRVVPRRRRKRLQQKSF